jgi:predicted transcriptional regulator
MIQILESISDGSATRTKIMFKAFLSFAQVKEYMAFLQERELVTYDETTTQYRTTEKGLEFLRKCDEIRNIVSVDKKVNGQF